jgi:hypothetical protein
MDPLSGKYPELSPYFFAQNNPILFVDSDGKDRTYYMYVIDKKGKTHLIATDHVKNKYDVVSRVQHHYGGGVSFGVFNTTTTITIDLRKEQGNNPCLARIFLAISGSDL